MRWLLIILFLASCGGVRKTDSSKISIKIDSISVNNERVLKQNVSFNRIVSLKPFDASKPIRIDGKDYFNASIVFDNSIIDNFEIANRDSSLSLGKSTTEKESTSERRDNTLLYLGMFLIFVVGIITWFKLPIFAK